MTDTFGLKEERKAGVLGDPVETKRDIGRGSNFGSTRGRKARSIRRAGDVKDCRLFVSGVLPYRSFVQEAGQTCPPRLAVLRVVDPERPQSQHDLVFPGAPDGVTGVPPAQEVARIHTRARHLKSPPPRFVTPKENFLHEPVVRKPSNMSSPRVNGFLGPLQETLVIHVQHELACDLRRRPKPVDPSLT